MTYRAWNTKEVDRAALKELTAAIAQQNTEELENQSMDDGPWSEEKYRSVFAAQQKEAGLLAGILAARGITDPAEALTLLAGEEELSDPMLLTDMDKACARILRAIDEGETIVVFGDYDVDGVTATALLYQHLKGMGASAKCMLPSREGDGYGLSKNAIQSIYDKGCRLIVTVDNGISAVEEAAFAASLGIDLIITDHHLPHESLPQAVAIVDPRRADDHSPFKGLCGAGVAFKLCAALDGCPPEEMLEYCGDLAAVGTVADVMPLTGENRTIVKAGLRQLQNTDRPGFCALLEEVGLAGRPVTAENVSYAIAPRINAAGRMDSAVTALQLVLCEDEDRAEELAHKLTDINSQRQETEMEIVRAAQELLDAEPERLEDRVILLWGRDWHPGVIGIVASRLVEKTGRPVIVVSVDEHGEGKGSGRSVQGFNLHECIASCADILLRFGGHAMAAGLSVREEDLPTLRQRLNDWAARECPVLRTPPLECDLSVHLDRLTVESVRRLDQLAPYGADNPSPVFVLEKAVVEGVYAVSEGKHCPPAAAAGQRQPLCGLVRDASRAGALCRRRRRGRGSEPVGLRFGPGAAAVGPHPGAAPGGPRQHCGGAGGAGAGAAPGHAPDARAEGRLSPRSAAISSPFTGSCRRGAGTPKICSPCSQSLVRRTPARRWWRSPRWNRSASSRRPTGAGPSSGSLCQPPARRTSPMRPS